MKVLDYVRQEPVRAYMYGVLAAGVGVLVAFGIIAASWVPVILALLAAALAIPSPVELVRSKVTPVESITPIEYAELPEPDQEEGNK